MKRIRFTVESDYETALNNKMKELKISNCDVVSIVERTEKTVRDWPTGTYNHSSDEMFKYNRTITIWYREPVVSPFSAQGYKAGNIAIGEKALTESTTGNSGIGAGYVERINFGFGGRTWGGRKIGAEV